MAPALSSEAISGTVTDGTNPIQNATVQAWQNNQKIQGTTTAQDGSYTLAGLAEGIYIVRAHKEGFYAQYLDNQPAPSNGVNVVKDVNPQPVWHISDSIQLTLVQFDRTLPVSLTAATATRVGDQIILRWLTESETNNLGWDIYRSDARDGKYRKINAAMIAGAFQSVEPHTYRFVDEHVEAGKVYFYYLENIDFDGKRHKSHLIQVEMLTTLGQIKYSALYPSFPNPFNPDTWIPFKLASDSPIVIDIYDIKGKLVRRMDLGSKEAGYYLDRRSAAHWDGRSQTGERVASGIYLYTIKAGKFTATRRMVMVK